MSTPLAPWLSSAPILLTCYSRMSISLAVGAMALLRSHSVDLLFTDVDLAHGTNGVALARDARALRSDLPVAYTSGRIDLTADQMVPGSVFLPKPYRLAEVIGLPDRLAKF